MRVMIYSIILFSLFLTACSNESIEQNAIRQAIAIEQGDECHLCGMLIKNFAGPKGELYQKHDTQIKKFCSTRDLFSYYLQPENIKQTEMLYVHNMAVTPWSHPSDEVFIDARDAWYVIGSTAKGAMGATLASFKTKEQAKAFAEMQGGKVIDFSMISIDLLNNLEHF